MDEGESNMTWFKIKGHLSSIALQLRRMCNVHRAQVYFHGCPCGTETQHYLSKVIHSVVPSKKLHSFRNLNINLTLLPSQRFFPDERQRRASCFAVERGLKGATVKPSVFKTREVNKSLFWVNFEKVNIISKTRLEKPRKKISQQ